MSQSIRAFIAIELPEELRGKLNSTQKLVQTQTGEQGKRAVRWVQAENIHLTLKFLGDVPTRSLPALTQFLQAEAVRHVPFSLSIGGIGAFPNLRQPRVIWVGCETPVSLIDLQKMIDQGTHALGSPSEGRPFSAHLTLGRISQNASLDEVKQVSQVLSRLSVPTLGTVQVDRFHLYQSDLRPSGPVYTSLNEYLLADV